MLRTSGLQPFWLSVYPLYLTKVLLWERYKKPHCQRWLSVPQNWISMNWTAIEIHSNPSLCVVQTNHSFRRIFTLVNWELGTYLKGRKNHMKKLWFCDLCNQFLEVWDHETIDTSNFTKIYLRNKFCRRKTFFLSLWFTSFAFQNYLLKFDYYHKLKCAELEDAVQYFCFTPKIFFRVNLFRKTKTEGLNWNLVTRLIERWWV